jgi:hypothetical protein
MMQLLQQMTTTLQAMNPNPAGNVAQVNRAELNLVKPTYFHGTDNEDPYEWLASFERAATANQWTNNRKIAIAAGYLRDAAAKWYDENQLNFQNWAVQGSQYNFTNQFLDYFANATMKNKWMTDLELIRQQLGQSVADYAQKYKMLVQRVDPARGFGQQYIVSKFIRGLVPHIMTMVVGYSPNNLDTAITKAKEIETGFVIAQPVQQQQIMVNQMELLQQQVSQLTANLANTQVQQSN